MAISVELHTPLAQALNEVIQPKLVEVGWSTGGGDDSALAEYVILMLVNGKTQEQIASELANDLLGLGPDDTEAVDFSRWLFEQVEALNKKLNGEPAEPEQQNPAQAIPSFTEASKDATPSADVSANVDTEMGDSFSPAREGGIPSGPRTMRNPRQNGRGRILGQISRAMDRSSDSVLHRVRNQHGTERINTHREPPKGPRAFHSRGGRPGGGRPAGGMGMNIMGMGNGPMHNMPPGSNMMTPQQQMQMMALFEEQARMMAQFMPGFVAPAINPAFQAPQAQPNGRSLFERAEQQPDRGNSFQRRHQNGRSTHQNTNMDVDGGSKGNAADVQMDDAPPQNKHQGQAPDGVCNFNLRCTNKDCPYAHQSPAAPEGTTIDISDACPFGAACKNRKCVARHPSPAKKTVHQSEELCRYFPHCQNSHCPFKHPTMPLCRNGADCSVPGCKFTHQQIPCRYNPCLNPSCPFKHAEGQKGVFSDKVWTPHGAESKSGQHVSERKFVADENGEEELIKPHAPSSSEPEIVT
ncbi:conserved hypothetical protein [Uncinocarpus reesii 1704]|uniref:Nab2-like CCCH zinc finger domain-containing protein n=1 Tax=Uncinocarpus reesii (strain UAMH 1704) TaxID=336963 RepID=C4JFW8_UNCRE|nr:uncharacterized protein UREG_01048 [Uncinocarpus reesii 1704]EEP76199.1 conserved hypothetical protein [Uncinocarpus reesii 1704]